MEPFIQPAQYHFMKQQVHHVLFAIATVKDSGVIQALKEVTLEKILAQFDKVTEVQYELLHPLVHLREQSEAIEYFMKIKQVVIPFSTITEKQLKKLYPKVKKLKLPVEQLDMKQISYYSIDDRGTNRRYIIVEQNGQFVGLRGTFTASHQQGICAICNEHTTVGMFSIEKKGAVESTYTSRANSICEDASKCNEQLVSRDKLLQFVDVMQ